MQKSGEIIAKILEDDLSLSESETTIELNFAVLKFKHTVKKKKDGIWIANLPLPSFILCNRKK